MKKLLCLSLLCAVFMSVSARAQTQDAAATSRDGTRYGYIDGVVLDDDTKEPLPGALVILRGLRDTIQTNLDGKFIIRDIIPGKYKLIIKMMGFETFKTKNIIIETAKRTKIEIKLRTKIEANNSGLGCPRSMVEPSQTGSVRVWTEDDIKRIPGH